MSDTLILGLSTLIAATVITPVLAYLIKRSESKITKKVDVIESKLDENHKQQNGNLTKLLETTSQLATAKEKAKNKEENKK